MEEDGERESVKGDRRNENEGRGPQGERKGRKQGGAQEGQGSTPWPARGQFPCSSPAFCSI